MSERAAPAPRDGFAIFYSLNTRWADNDIYGHINNVAYYAFFDSVVNRFLIEEGGMRPVTIMWWDTSLTRQLTISHHSPIRRSLS